MKHIHLYLFALISVILTSCSHACQKVELQEDTVSLLRNPCMGWGVYDDANDEVQNANIYWAAQDEAARQYASFFYVRWRWSDMEPEEGKYAWLYDENYKKLIQGALDRGLKLCFRIYNNGQDNLRTGTPDYVRRAGAKGYTVKGLKGDLWTPYPDDPIFQEKLEKFVEAFAKEYDNPDIVDFVDGYSLGWWGECHHVILQDQNKFEQVFDWFTTLYSTHFKNVLLTLPFGSQIGFDTEKRITVTGIPGHGKSDFVDEIVLRLCTRQDWRAGYFSPENTPIEYHHAKLAEKLLGHRFRKDFSTEEEFARVVDYLSQRVWHILPDGDFTLGNVLSKARELVHRHGIRVFVIDPYNYINHQIPAGMTETGYIGSFMNSLARFARLNSCLVILVAHPRKMNKQYGTQKTEVPTMYDINGSANFFNMTDYGIVVDRQDEMGIVYIHVEKTRFRNFGTKGNAAFCYDVTNGRYSPCTPPPEPGMQVQPWKGAKDLFSSEGWI